MKRKKTFIILCLLSLVFLLFPFIEITVVPHWRLQVVDEQGQPFSNRVMIQTWLNYSLEFWRDADHRDESVTDDAGYVEFPERKIKVSIIQIFLSKIRDFVNGMNPHASYGSHSFVRCKDKAICDATYQNGKELKNKIIVKN